jgi:hypothetical protein
MMEAAGRFRFSHGENAVEPCACVQLKELRLAKVHADSASGRALPDRFTSGTQLYVYLQRHNCIGLTEGRAREQGTICLHLRSEEQEQGYQALRLDKKGDAAEMKTFR